MQRARIFVADDDKGFLDLMRGLLEEEGYSVALLCSTSSAHQEIRDVHPDLIILDIVMGHADGGIALLGKLRVDPETALIPVIVCSADTYSLRDKQDYLLSMGCVTVEKPFDIDVMLATIAQTLNPQR